MKKRALIPGDLRCCLPEPGGLPTWRQGGKGRQKSAAELLFGLLTDRYERGSVLVTSNLDFASWTEVFGNPQLTAAPPDRLTHRCHIIQFQGDSFQFKESLRRQEKAVDIHTRRRSPRTGQW